jgi:hypothetical protein
LPLDDLAADSMRLRAHASTKAVRTLVRSKRRLSELAAVDEQALGEAEREQHRAKVAKHRQAVAECEARRRTSIVTTNPSAALMKFPDGAGLPGHRISAMAAGVEARFVVAVLVSADTNDYGLLEPIVTETTRVLARSRVSEDTPLQVAADAGYCARAALAFAERVRARIDILIMERDVRGGGVLRTRPLHLSPGWLHCLSRGSPHERPLPPARRQGEVDRGRVRRLRPAHRLHPGTNTHPLHR